MKSTFSTALVICLLAACVLLPALAQEAGTKTRVVPPGFELRDVRVEVSPPRTRVEVIPATFKTVTDQVMVEEATPTSPAKFETITRRELDKPAATRNVQIPGEYRTIQQLVPIGSAKDAPAKDATVETRPQPAYEFRDVRTEVSPPHKRLVVVPAKFQTVTERVLLKEATDTRPAEYQTITRRKLVTPATTREVEVPGEYKTVRKRVCVDGGEPQAKAETPAVGELLTPAAPSKTGTSGGLTPMSVVEREERWGQARDIKELKNEVADIRTTLAEQNKLIAELLVELRRGQ